MKPTKKVDWAPADGLVLEDNAMTVVTTNGNSLVVAGPGAGKTELLAQKACYLLQTNICKFPYKILAISFKRDAAYNLKERVKLRCGEELSKRFDSLTFDSFAKQILDRFKEALPIEYRISSEYEVITNENFIHDYYKIVDEEYCNHTTKNEILEFHAAEQLVLSNNSKENQIRKAVWQKMLGASKSMLSFKMIMRLAELIIKSNPIIRKYLQKTYHFVFLDEFQDTTKIQYDFFRTCFRDSETLFTAVGDDKQRIMLWAGAKKTIFEDFVADNNASRIPLAMNFRCAPRLVTLLNHLTEHLLRKRDFATPSTKWTPEQGECNVWIFDNPESETRILYENVRNWISTDKLNPRDICILVKQQLDQYAGTLIQFFNENGLRARDENKYQDLLTQEITQYVLHTISTVFNNRPSESKNISLSFLRNLHTELEDDQLLKLEAKFHSFTKRIKKEYNHRALTDSQLNDMIDEIFNYANIDRIKALYPQYRSGAELNSYITTIKEELYNCYEETGEILSGIDKLLGIDTIPVMTIHKSKGLEYHTIVFIGLEDGAFWSFEKQPDEDKCAFFVALSRAKERVIFTFSKKREGRFGMKPQTAKNINVIFKELERSNIVDFQDFSEK